MIIFQAFEKNSNRMIFKSELYHLESLKQEKASLPFDNLLRIKKKEK